MTRIFDLKEGDIIYGELPDGSRFMTIKVFNGSNYQMTEKGNLKCYFDNTKLLPFADGYKLK